MAAIKSGYVDHSRPTTHHLSKKMNVYKKRRMMSTCYDLKEHEKNLASLNRRMMEVGSMQERKKNPFDPIGNPVFFFTKD